MLASFTSSLVLPLSCFGSPLIGSVSARYTSFHLVPIHHVARCSILIRSILYSTLLHGGSASYSLVTLSDMFH